MKPCIKPRKLQFGDTIGIIAPSQSVSPEQMEQSLQKLRELGFQIKLSEHLYSNASGFSGTVRERAQDLNTMIADDSVQMLLFGGGEVGNELLYEVDYESILRHPKIFCSYSDSTTLLNAINYATGLITFYGASPRTFRNLTDYNWRSFQNRLMKCELTYTPAAPWKTIVPGKCEGNLVGGYLSNFAALHGLDCYRKMPYDPCILFLEDHDSFSSPAAVSKWITNLEHRGVFENVSGLIFGHYSSQESPLIDQILSRVGERYCIPVVRCEDFGHGKNNSILPIGIHAGFDTATGLFAFTESGISGTE